MRPTPFRSWTFLTHHAHVLLAIEQDPARRVDEIAEAAGITERSAYRILVNLVESGYVRRTRVGRRNVYAIDRGRPLADPVLPAHTVESLCLLGAAGAGMPGEDVTGGPQPGGVGSSRGADPEAATPEGQRAV